MNSTMTSKYYLILSVKEALVVIKSLFHLVAHGLSLMVMFFALALVTLSTCRPTIL